MKLLAALTLASSAVYALPSGGSAPADFVPGQLYYAPTARASGAHAEVHAPGPGHHGEIEGHYMVVLHDNVSATQFLMHQQLVSAAQVAAVRAGSAPAASAQDGSGEIGIRHVYDLSSHLQGYAGRFSDDVLAYIRAQPEVAYVERDSIVKTTVMPYDAAETVVDDPFLNLVGDASGHIRAQHKAAAHADAASADPHSVEKGAPWGLARISHRAELGFSTFNKYVYDAAAGEGVTAYIIDTGIYTQHAEFEGRARWGKTMPQGDTDTDGNGHGTHCAGTIGSAAYGVAKKAELVAVKVLGSGGSGSMSDVTAGVLWAVEDAKSISKALAASPNSSKAKKHKGFVANMSLGGGKSPTLDRAVNGAVDAGLHFAVAAGNEGQSACNSSPASAENPITIMASDVGDRRASFSNYGECADLFAPGVNIKSTWNSGKDSTNSISGTSMATPHVVGLLAYMLSIYGSADFAIIKDARKMPSLKELHAAHAAADAKSLGDHVKQGAQALLASSPLLASFVPSALLERLLSLDEPSLESGSAAGALKKKGGDGDSQPDVVSVLHPKDLKKALAAFATSGIIADPGQGSVNKLVFNNATASAGRFW